MQLYMDGWINVVYHEKEEREVSVEHLPVYRVRVCLHDCVVVRAEFVWGWHALCLERQVHCTSFVRFDNLSERVIVHH